MGSKAGRNLLNLCADLDLIACGVYNPQADGVGVDHGSWRERFYCQ